MEMDKASSHQAFPLAGGAWKDSHQRREGEAWTNRQPLLLLMHMGGGISKSCVKRLLFYEKNLVLDNKPKQLVCFQIRRGEGMVE